MKLLFVDTETGGLDPELHSLLSIGLVSWEHGKIKNKQEFLILDDIFRITPDAQAINKIDYNNFIEKASTKEFVYDKILNFLFKSGFSEVEPITLAGHNVGFDIGFLKKFFGGNYSNLFSHRSIDTASILKFMYLSGKIEKDISSSDEAFEYFGITTDNRHTAIGDAISTAKLFNELLAINSKTIEEEEK